MNTDNSNSRLAEIKAFAIEHGLEESFNSTFSRLENYSGKGYGVNPIATLHHQLSFLNSDFNDTVWFTKRCAASISPDFAR
jgi:hypothetical protein